MTKGASFSIGAWEQLRRKALAPDLRSFSIISTLEDAGPTVAKIFVFFETKSVFNIGVSFIKVHPRFSLDLARAAGEPIQTEIRE